MGRNTDRQVSAAKACAGMRSVTHGRRHATRRKYCGWMAEFPGEQDPLEEAGPSPCAGRGVWPGLHPDPDLTVSHALCRLGWCAGR